MDWTDEVNHACSAIDLGGKFVHRKLLAFINIKALAFAVVAPVVALAGVSGYVIADQKRLSLERSVEQSVSATLYAAERELSKHLAAAEILASMARLNRLEGFTEHMDEIMNLRRGEWLNVIIMDRTGHVYNYMRSQSGEPLPVSLRPDLDALVMDTRRYNISPVLVSERYNEPYYQIRVPIFDPGSNGCTACPVRRRAGLDTYQRCPRCRSAAATGGSAFSIRCVLLPAAPAPPGRSTL